MTRQSRVVRYDGGEEEDLSASTITDDYELSADFRHLELRDVVGCARERWRVLLRVMRRRAETETEASIIRVAARRKRSDPFGHVD